MNSGAAGLLNVSSAAQPTVLCAEDDIAAMLSAVRSVAQRAGCLHVSHMPVPNGQCVILFIPSGDSQITWQAAAPVSALVADELVDDLDLALKHYHSPLALKSNGLARRLDLTLQRRLNDTAQHSDGVALKRILRAGVDVLANSPRSKDHELAAYFNLRYERGASNADMQRELCVSERTVQRFKKDLIHRLAEVICEMQSAS